VCFRMINKERECFGMINCVYMAVYLAHIPKHPERERERQDTGIKSLHRQLEVEQHRKRNEARHHCCSRCVGVAFTSCPD
jgi:hypothetical protein